MSNHGLNENGTNMVNAQNAPYTRQVYITAISKTARVLYTVGLYAAHGSFLGAKLLFNTARRIWPGHEPQEILVSPTSSLGQVALPPVAPRPTFLEIFDESQYPVFWGICKLLPVDSIIALSQTCKPLSNLYKRIQPTQWNIDRRLKEYFKDPSRVRSLMGEFNALISGRFVVEFFERTKFPQKRSLEIYVRGAEAAQFVPRLIQEDGYVLKVPIQEVSFPNVVKEYLHYERESSTGPKQLRIGITRVIPIVAIINLERYSTICLNIISWNKAYAIFPKSSFISHKGFLAHALDGNITDDYSRYGWRIQDVQWGEDERGDKSFGLTRRVGDKYTWIISFDTTNVSWSPTPDFVLEYAVFSIETYKLNRTGPFHYYGYKTSTGHRSTALLRYPYAIPGHHSGGMQMPGFVSWVDFLNDRLGRLTPIEISKLAPANRPTNFAQILNGEVGHWDISHDTFTNSDYWVYWDEEIPAWYKLWEEDYSGVV
ncbi:hypothetical protein MMC31_006918 [Peltigera leucophlebia]|nr:hypothetical protein [Peltigera leucophlebia]